MEQKAKKSFGQKIKELLTAKSVGGVIVRIIILLAIPYAYLLLCGLIFDKWLRLYQATTFIFISLCVLYLIAIVLCVLTIKWYAESKKGGKKPHKKETRKKAEAAPVKETPAEAAPAEVVPVEAVPVEAAPAETEAAAPAPVEPAPVEQISELAAMAETLKTVEEEKTEA